MSSWPSATGSPMRGQLADGQVQRAGVRVGDEAQPGAAGQAGQPFERGSRRRARARGRGWRRRGRPARARAARWPASRWSAARRRRRRRPASPPARSWAAASAHIRRTCSRASASVCSIQGMPPTTSAPRSTASRTSSSAPGSHSSPSCGNATTCRSTTPRNSSRRASSGITPSSRALVSTSAKASTCRTPCRTASTTARRAFGSIQAPVVVRLDRGRQLDRGERGGHAAGGVRRQRGIADLQTRSRVCTLSRCRWALTKLSVTSAPAASTSSRPPIASWRDHRYPVAVDADPPATVPCAQRGVRDDQVVVGHCRLMSSPPPREPRRPRARTGRHRGRRPAARRPAARRRSGRAGPRSPGIR